MRLSSIDIGIRANRECFNTIDPTTNACTNECLRKVYWEQVRCIVPSSEPTYFISGRAWDQAMHYIESMEFTTPEGELLKQPSLGVRWEYALKAMNSVYDSARCDFIDPKRDRANLMKLLELFIEQNSNPPYKVLASNLHFKLPYKDFQMGGELDSYYSWPPYGVVVNENKTTSIVIGSKNYERYKDSFTLGQYGNQLLHYLWAVSQISEDVYGTHVRVASLDIPKRESTIRQQFDSVWLSPAREQIHDYLTVCQESIARLRRAWKKWRWPKEGRHCTGAWGLTACPYRHLCLMPVPLHLMEDNNIPWQLYMQAREWKPWDGDKGR